MYVCTQVVEEGRIVSRKVRLTDDTDEENSATSIRDSLDNEKITLMQQSLVSDISNHNSTDEIRFDGEDIDDNDLDF
jgi:hypothetical protein